MVQTPETEKNVIETTDKEVRIKSLVLQYNNTIPEKFLYDFSAVLWAIFALMATYYSAPFIVFFIAYLRAGLALFHSIRISFTVWATARVDDVPRQPGTKPHA